MGDLDYCREFCFNDFHRHRRSSSVGPFESSISSAETCGPSAGFTPSVGTLKCQEDGIFNPKLEMQRVDIAEWVCLKSVLPRRLKPHLVCHIGFLRRQRLKQKPDILQ